MYLSTFILLTGCIITIRASTLINGNVTLILEPSNTNGIYLELLEGKTQKLIGNIGMGIKFAKFSTTKTTFSATALDVEFIVQEANSGFNIYFRSTNTSHIFQDCFQIGNAVWFNGQEGNSIDWPIEKSVVKNEAYIVSNKAPISEPYWLNSLGAYIFVNEKTPLFVDLNNVNVNNLCLSGNLIAPYLDQEEVVRLNYTISAKENAREAHLHAINTYLGRPIEVPNSELVKFSTWSTSIKYGKQINDQLLYEFAQSVQSYRFRGQIQVEDGWEDCYGSFKWKRYEFADIERTLMNIHSLALNVIVGVHPFVNVECEEVVKDGLTNGYFVKGTKGELLTSWWNGNSAYLIDFSNSEANDWFLQRLRNLSASDLGIDGFRLLAGEPSWTPNGIILNDELTPNALTKLYNSMANVTAYGRFHSAWRNQQNPSFVTIPDKESNWSQENGLQSVIINLMQLNIAGYTMVSAGVIGGKSVERPTPELFIRWLQAVALTPVLTFGYLPWEIISPNYDVLQIVQKFSDLHNKYSTKLINVMKKCMTMGLPVNAPVWWIDSENPETFKIVDQYLLGEDFLVAPVLVEGATSRDIYLPPGTWEDGNTRTVYQGNQTLKDFPAPIDTLPFFQLIKD